MSRSDQKHPYHHGDLRRALLDAALDAIAKDGPAALSLRDVARHADVSHAAPTHHFRNKAGLLTAIATEGYHLMADELERVRAVGDLTEAGVAYVLFAVNNRAHFTVMCATNLLDTRNAGFVAARERVGHRLFRGAAKHQGPADPTMALAAWALMHGLANLLLEGNVRPDPGSDPEQLARSIVHLLLPG